MNLYRRLGLNDLRLLWQNSNRTFRFFILNHHLHTLMRRTHRSDMMSSNQWEIYLVRMKQLNSIVQREQEKRKGEKSHRSHPSEDITNFKAGTTEVDPRFARSPAPTPETQVNEQAENEDQAENRFVTRSGRQWGLASVNTNECEDELDDSSGDVGRTSITPRMFAFPYGLGTSHLIRSLPLRFKQWEVWNLAHGSKHRSRVKPSNG